MKDILITKAKSQQGKFTLSDADLDAGSVACALVTDKGNIYTGINVDLSCGIEFCAEHAAVAEMLKNRETKIDMIVAYGKNKILPPCGRCRELLMQINNENAYTKVIISKDKIILLKDLLPYYWND